MSVTTCTATPCTSNPDVFQGNCRDPGPCGSVLILPHLDARLFCSVGFYPGTTLSPSPAYVGRSNPLYRTPCKARAWTTIPFYGPADHSTQREHIIFTQELLVFFTVVPAGSIWIFVPKSRLGPSPRFRGQGLLGRTPPFLREMSVPEPPRLDGNNISKPFMLVPPGHPPTFPLPVHQSPYEKI